MLCCVLFVLIYLSLHIHCITFTIGDFFLFHWMDGYIYYVQMCKVKEMKSVKQNRRFHVNRISLMNVDWLRLGKCVWVFVCLCVFLFILIFVYVDAVYSMSTVDDFRVCVCKLTNPMRISLQSSIQRVEKFESRDRNHEIVILNQ